MMPVNNLTFNQKTGWLIRITCLFWLVAKLISFRLWLSDRLFPLIPPFDFLAAPSFVHWGLFIVSLICLLLLLVYPHKKTLQVIIIAAEVLSCLFDQNRWQPWEFQYIFTILIVLLNSKNEKHIMSLVGFMLASIYFYSGLCKINPVFLQSIWYKLLLSKTFHVSYQTAHQTVIYYSGYLLGLIEVVLGIGLFLKRLRKITTILLIVMHLIIIGIFGPIGLNYDHVIWPWNLTMLGLLFILILKNSSFDISLASLKLPKNIPIVILFGIMPFFSLFGRWDFFLSSSLFSSRTTDMYICLKKDRQTPLTGYCGKSLAPCDSNSCIINTRTWAFEEMKVPAYPQTRVYEKVKKKLEAQFPDMQATYFIYTYRNGKKVKAEMR